MGAASPAQQQPPKISADAIASRLLLNSKVASTKEGRREIRKELSKTISSSPPSSLLSSPKTRVNIGTSLSSTKARKTAGIGSIYPEFLKKLRPHGHD